MTNQFRNLSAGGDNFTQSAASSYQQFLTDSECIAVRIFDAFIGSVGLVGNVTVVAIILHQRFMLDIPSTWFVLSLAVADTLFCLAVIPLTNAICSGSYIMILGVVSQFITMASAGNLFTLTFNRFLSVYNSLRYPALMTCSRAKCLVLIPWVTSFLLSAVVGVSIQAGIQKIHYIHSSYYTVLIILTSGLNIYMLKLARNKRKDTVQRLNGFIFPNDKLLKNEIYMLVRLLTLALTFFGASIPTTVLLFLYPTSTSRITRSFLRKMVWCLLALLFNSAVDPFIYSAKHPIFQRYFKKARNRIFPQNTM